jgi:putative membrane protein
MAGSEAPQRYLVLCVDRDDDLGTKARVDTPVVGRGSALAAATKLALADPEEADANAIFAAIKKYDELTRGEIPCEVAVVCGEVNRGFEADRRLGKQVASVLSGSSYTGVVLVSDGGDDELVIPIIQSLKPIVSVERVAVKHSQTVEETYQVLGRYLRMLIFDPHYSKYALGVPGLILILAGILAVTGHGFEAALATVLIIGGAALIRGFDVDRTVAGLLHRGPTGYLRLFSMISAVIVVISGIDAGYVTMTASEYWNRVVINPSLFFVYGGTLIGSLLSGSINLVWAGISIYSVGALLSHVARDSVRWRRDGYVLVMLAMLYFPVLTFSDFLISGTAEATFLLISYILLGLVAVFVLTITIYPRVRARPPAETE